MQNSITVVITTHNEEKNIKDCIKSAKILTNQIILVDMDSTDSTKHIAKQEGVKLYNFPFSRYVEPSRECAMNKVKTDWVFILDADERITEHLAKDISEKIANTEFTHFKIARKNIFGHKKWLKYGGWWPDYQLRLIKKSAFQSWSKRIHSTPVIKGELAFIDEPFVHYFHGDLHSMVQKTTVYEEIEADLLYQAGRDVSVTTLFRKFFGELFRRLIKNKGFLDGKIGILESVYQAYSKAITYLYLYEKKSSSV